MTKKRTTGRKQALKDALRNAAETPMVLEELRWAVMRRELQDSDPPEALLSISHQKSFNRSVRTFLSEVTPGLILHKCFRPGWTAGLLARVAIYRLNDLKQLEQFLSSPSRSFHFWSNARTADVWEEPVDGEVTVRNPALLPPNAPKRLPSLYPGRSRWPRSSPERRAGLERLGPKYIKRPLVCIKLCLRDVESPEETDALAVIRIPANMPLTVIGPAELELKRIEVPDGGMYRRRQKVTRAIEGDEVIA